MIEAPGYFRIVTWNCNGGQFDWKAPMISALNPDVAIIQEIAAPKNQDLNCCWAPTLTAYKGVAVITRNGFSVEPIQRDPQVPDIFLPVIIHGPVEFHLLAVWTQKVSGYIESCKPVFEKYRDFLLSKPSVITGDFNSNAIWDYLHPKISHTITVNYLMQEFGLVSSYHKKINVDQGKEQHPTFYLYRWKNKPYHYDYCFVPDYWDIKNVEVGEHEEWAKYSDHCPLVVDIAWP
ncbi:MAG: hypothetical protein NTV68_05320 [Methanomicrobiales archaeon]|nr:hypothetical protein [Methanomicrobiales archaeon]